ncbi:MAG: START domain-containing protein [Myxococcota bacterium]|nr:START domain-containing protein [Myxococcota bacterium]
MRLRFCLTLCFLLSPFCMTAGATPPDPIGPGNWETLGERKGVKRSRKYIKRTGLFAVRGEIVINRPMDIVASVVCDHTRWTEWTKTLERSEVLGRDQNNALIVYQVFDMPIILSDRDVVYSFSLRQVGNQYHIVGQTRPGQTGPKSVGVRMNLEMGRWVLTPNPDGSTHLVLEVLMDPKGVLPKWFVNIVQRNYTADTLDKLRAQAQKKDIVPLMNPPQGCALKRP